MLSNMLGCKISFTLGRKDFHYVLSSIIDFQLRLTLPFSPLALGIEVDNVVFKGEDRPGHRQPLSREGEL